jgi:hypothetical protein
MFPYTAEEAEWLSMLADSPYWLVGPGDFDSATLATPANDETPRQDHGPAR